MVSTTPHRSSHASALYALTTVDPRTLLKLLYAVYVLTALGIPIVQAAKRWPNNFLIFRMAARHLWTGRDLYIAYPGVYYDLFKYSPTFGILVAPFAFLPVWLGLLIWNGIIAAAFVYAVARLYAAPRDRVIVLAIAWWAFYVATRGAQTNAAVAALMVLTVIELDRGRQRHAAAAVVLGAAIKLFPIATLPFALLRRGWLRLALWCVGYAAVGLALPLLVVSPSILRAEYRSWHRIEQVDAFDRGDSVMGMLHDWFAITWPTWTVQLAATLILVAPLLVRLAVQRKIAHVGADQRFMRLWLASVLMYVVLFNHQAEFQSYIIAVTGVALWFVESSRRWPFIVWAFVCAVGLHPLPYIITWGVLQVQLLRRARRADDTIASPSESREHDVPSPYALSHGI